MSPDKDKKESGQSASSREADKSSGSQGSQSKQGMGPTAVRGDQAPPGTTRAQESSRSSSEAERAKREPDASPAPSAGSYRDLPRGYKATPAVGLQGLKRRAAVSLDLQDPSRNVLVYSALEDEVTGAKVAVEQEPLEMSEVESRRQKLGSQAQNQG
jgi:hypothetical protein